MNFTLEKSIQILERTPNVLDAMLSKYSADWTLHNEGGESWSVYDFIGHLIPEKKQIGFQEQKSILFPKIPTKKFEKYDRFAQFEESKGKSFSQLLNEFKILREKNIEILRSLNITDKNLQDKGIHPAFGEVTLSQLLSTWVVHDLNHISQISRVMAKQYKPDVGPMDGILKNIATIN